MDFSASTRLGMGCYNPIPQIKVDPAPPPTRVAPLLAESIHACSLRLMAINDRLTAALERLAGPMPVEAASGQPVGQAPKAPAPDGALLLAQFGLALIHKEIDRTRNLVESLEEIA